MFSPFNQTISSMPLLDKGVSRAITAENPKGEKGAGGQAYHPVLGQGRKGSPAIKLVKAGETVTLADIEGAGIINHMWITVTPKTDYNNMYVLRDIVLKMYWDGEENPSVEVPLGDFFCLGFGAVYKVNSALVSVNTRGGMNSYFQMPFKKAARIEIENQHRVDIPMFFYQIDYTLYPEGFSDDLDLAYFHAQWRRTPITTPGEDHVILDGVKGRGKYIGTFFSIQTLNRFWWGEGEVKFYIDGDGDFPTICGTGTEDYFGGAWCYTKKEGDRYVEDGYQTPYLGYCYFSTRDDTIEPRPFHDDTVVPMRSLYRWHVVDPIRFENDLKVIVQSIGLRGEEYFEREDDISTVSYWYQTHPHADFPRLPSREERWPR